MVVKRATYHVLSDYPLNGPGIYVIDVMCRHYLHILITPYRKYAFSVARLIINAESEMYVGIPPTH